MGSFDDSLPRGVRWPLQLTTFLVGPLFLAACAHDPPLPPQAPAPQVTNTAAALGKTAASPGPFAYRLPVSGAWVVTRTHYGATNDQAYALDLVVKAGTTAGVRVRKPMTVTANASNPSYGQPILADGPGVVVVVVDGVPENVPGVVNNYDFHGNFLIIDHENGEYSLMAHIIPGSFTVRTGQRVAPGTPLASCGNSGHSTGTHLHWQVMDNVNPSVAHGIAPRLQPYERNGAMTVEIPQSGDVLVGP